jgi:DNA-binding NtrC family response regulator
MGEQAAGASGRDGSDHDAAGRPTVAVVDDDSAVCRMVADVAETCGWRARQCADGRALMALLAEEGAPDLVVLDVVMPEADGIQVLRHLGREHPDLRVVLISGADPLFGESAATLARAARIELVASLRKPLGLQRLREVFDGARD